MLNVSNSNVFLRVFHKIAKIFGVGNDRRDRLACLQDLENTDKDGMQVYSKHPDGRQKVVLKVKNPSTKQEEQSYSFFFYDTNDRLGKGVFGTVYRGYPIDQETGRVLSAKPVAIKVLDRKHAGQDKIKKEVRLQSEYYATFQPLVKEEYAYVVMEYLPGRRLSEQQTLDALKITSPSERTAAQAQLALQVNMYHNPSLRRTEITHRDIHDQNIMVDFIGKHDEYDNFLELPGQRGVNISLIDFGESIVESEREKEYPEGKFKSKNYAYAPEMAYGKFGHEMDIYALTDQMISLLNAEQNQRYEAYMAVYKGKKGNECPVSPEEKEALCQEATDAGIAKKCKLTDGARLPPLKNGLDIREITQLFFDRMQDEVPEKRPSSDEVLRFSITLHNLTLNWERGIYLETANLYCAKMLLLANNYWNLKIGKKVLPHYACKTDAGVVTTEEADKTFEDYDFVACPGFCAAVVALYKRGMLKEDLIVTAAKNEGVACLVAAFSDQQEDPQKLDKLMRSPLLQGQIDNTVVKAIKILGRKRMLDLKIAELLLSEKSEQSKGLVKAILFLNHKEILDKKLMNILESLEDNADIAKTKAKVFLNAVLQLQGIANTLQLKKTTRASVGSIIARMLTMLHDHISSQTLQNDADVFNSAKLLIFKAAYLEDYKSSMFSRSRLCEGDINRSICDKTSDEIEKYANRNRNSRTERIWQQLNISCIFKDVSTLQDKNKSNADFYRNMPSSPAA